MSIYLHEKTTDQMKKLLCLLSLTAISFGTFAANDCSNPTTVLTPFLGPTWPCGYTNDAALNGGNTFCYQKAKGNVLYQDFQGCQTLPQAPLNNGLIFLIVAGAGLGTYMTIKKSKLKNNEAA